MNGMTETILSADAAANSGVPIAIDGKQYIFTGLTYRDLGQVVGVARGVAYQAWRSSVPSPQSPRDYMLYRLELNNILYGQYGQSALEFPLFPGVVVEMIYLSIVKVRGQAQAVDRETVWRWCDDVATRDTLIQTILMLTTGPERAEAKKPDGETDPTLASSSASSTPK